MQQKEKQPKPSKLSDALKSWKTVRPASEIVEKNRGVLVHRAQKKYGG